tara:strand:- start:142 stop:1305 length:1164 start_codon:yes stop_codon:yes gene_type:complete
MSEIKVNSIKGVAATTAALTINNTDGTCTANITNNLSNRNLIINGAMQVAQRATSSTTSGFGDLDRWKHEYGVVDESPTFAQVSLTSSDTPYTFGLTKATKITNGNQTSGLQATSIINFMQAIEAQDIRNSGWNYTSDTSFITLSFWVRASVAQNYHGFIKTADGTNYAYPFELGSLSANTWTKITKTIPGNSNLTINDDSGAGLQIFPITFLGTAYTGNSINNDAWMTWTSSTRTKDQTTTWFTTNDATFEITGVQLEVSDHATDFEHRSFGEELALCQRYYQQSYQTGTSAGTNTATNAINWYPDATTNYSSVSFGLPCVMRTQPTVTIYSRTGASGKIRNADASTDHNSYVNTNNNSFLMLTVNNSSISQSSTVSCHYTASAEL